MLKKILVTTLLLISATGFTTAGTQMAEQREIPLVIVKREPEDTAEASANRDADVETSEDTNTAETEENEKQDALEQESQEQNTSAEPQKPSYTFSDQDLIKYALTKTNVRDEPSQRGTKVSELQKGQGVHITGQCNETGWYRTEAGYFSNHLVSDMKPEEQKPEPKKTADAPSGNNTSPSPAPESNVSNTSAGSRYTWSASPGTQEEIFAGKFVIWAQDYYVSDIRSAAGKQILSLRTGDIVSVNGRSVQIDGQKYMNYNTDYLEDVWAAIGGKRPCFQTCLPKGGGNIIIQYGHYI